MLDFFSSSEVVRTRSATNQVMKLLEAVELKPSRGAMERALDEMDWGGIVADNDAFFAVFRAAFRREKPVAMYLACSLAPSTIPETLTHCLRSG